ncbi:hypothetical protein ACO2RV_01895 [Ancylobacter sp. VNQ12]|uniref:hypothetical protein n=1 Tax=Ancylobacter sp. VNQ12 TaxID=3400920 RepID=UPI003BFD3004
MVGFSSSETTSGAAILNAGSIGFVGGILFLGLGFLHRALVDIAQRLDGIVHFEPEEEETTERGAILDVVEELPPVSAPLPERKPAAPVVAAEPELEPESTATSLEAEEAKTSRGGLPSWFRRKREAEPEPVLEPEPPFEPEPAAEAAPDFEPLPPFRPAGEAPRRDLPAFLRTGSATAPAERPLAGGFGSEPRPAEPRFPDLRFGEPRIGEPRTSEPKISEPRISEPRISEPRIAEPRAPEPRAPEPRAPEMPAPRDVPPRDELEPGPPPTFLRESDLLGDDEPLAPEVTVLKSGTIGGMAYKLYSDGSIEADLPDGTLRFASLQELRDHVAGSAARSED